MEGPLVSFGANSHQVFLMRSVSLPAVLPHTATLELYKHLHRYLLADTFSCVNQKVLLLQKTRLCQWFQDDGKPMLKHSSSVAK